MSRRIKHWEVDLVNGYGRVVSTRIFYDLEEARAYRDKHLYRDPGSLGSTIMVDSRGGESYRNGLHEK